LTKKSNISRLESGEKVSFKAKKVYKDLGVRISIENKKVGVINSTTYEEANNNVANWIRQRSNG